MSDMSDWFGDVDIEDIPDPSSGERKRNSKPILDYFIDTGKYSVSISEEKLKEAGFSNAKSAQSSLTLYARYNNRPVKTISRDGLKILYLIRLDIDKNGNPIPDWRDQLNPGSGPLTRLAKELVSEFINSSDLDKIVTTKELLEKLDKDFQPKSIHAAIKKCAKPYGINVSSDRGLNYKYIKMKKSRTTKEQRGQKLTISRPYIEPSKYNQLEPINLEDIESVNPNLIENATDCAHCNKIIEANEFAYSLSKKGTKGIVYQVHEDCYKVIEDCYKQQVINKNKPGG